MADKPVADKTAPEEINVDPHPSTPLERIRYVPEWEVPVNPPKRPFFSPAKLSKTLKRSRLAAAIRPKQRSSPRSSFAPGSNESLHKEGSLVTAGGILPTAHSTFDVRSAPPSTYQHETLPSRLRRRLDAAFPPHRKYPCGLTRATCIVLFAALALIVLVLALGLGLGLGLRGRASGPRELPLPDGGKTYDGELTYYSPALGACGIVSTEGEAICAVAWQLFDAAGPSAASGGNPNLNPLCGKRIRVTRNLAEDPSTGNVTVDVTVVDRCTGCQPTDLDLSPSVFNKLAQQDRGRVRGSWQWL